MGGGAPHETDTDSYDGASFTRVATLPFVADRAGAYAVGNKIYLFGGGPLGMGQETGSLDTSSARNQWVTLARSPVDFGGWSPTVGQFGSTLLVEARTNVFSIKNFHRYDITSNTWAETPLESPSGMHWRLAMVGATVYALGTRNDANFRPGVVLYKLLALP